MPGRGGGLALVCLAMAVASCVEPRDHETARMPATPGESGVGFTEATAPPGAQPQTNGYPTDLGPASLQGTIATSRCPDEPWASLAELGLGQNHALLVSPDMSLDVSGWELLDPGGGRRRVRVAPIGQGWMSFRGVSPEHRRFAFYAIREEGDQIELWVADPVTGEVVRVVGGLERVHRTRWVSDQRIALFRSGEGADSYTWLIVNTASGEQELLPPLWLPLDTFIFSPDASRLLYLDYSPKGRMTVHMRDFGTDADDEVLPWLDPQVFNQGRGVTLLWHPRGLSIGLVSERSLVLATDLPNDALRAETVPTRTLLFDRASALGSSGEFVPGGGWFVVYRGFGDYHGDPDTEWQFLALDTEDGRLYDYCLPPEWRAPQPIEGSPDGRFVSFSRMDIPSALILDLETGRRTLLPGEGIWGWIATDE